MRGGWKSSQRERPWGRVRKGFERIGEEPGWQRALGGVTGKRGLAGGLRNVVYMADGEGGEWNSFDAVADC